MALAVCIAALAIGVFTLGGATASEADQPAGPWQMMCRPDSGFVILWNTQTGVVYKEATSPRGGTILGELEKLGTKGNAAK